MKNQHIINKSTLNSIITALSTIRNNINSIRECTGLVDAGTTKVSLSQEVWNLGTIIKHLENTRNNNN